MDQRSQRERQLFFSQQNESMLYGILSKNFQQRLGTLNEKQSSRLERALEHYMSEVFQANAQTMAEDADRETAWNTMVGIWPDFANYQLKTERRIPLVRLTRIS